MTGYLVALLIGSALGALGAVLGLLSLAALGDDGDEKADPYYSGWYDGFSEATDSTSLDRQSRRRDGRRAAGGPADGVDLPANR